MTTSSLTKKIAVKSNRTGLDSVSGRKNRFDALVERLRQVAVNLGPGAKLPGVYDLRDSMGVSIATLTSALNELEARRMIVRRPGIGIFVSPNIGKRTISLVCDPMFFQYGGASPFWSILVQQARSRAESHNEVLDMHFTSIFGDRLALPGGLISDIESGRIDGVLYVGTFKEGVAWIETHHTPIVVFAGPGPFQVRIDTEAVIRAGAAALAMAGCRKLALWMPDDRVIVSGDAKRFRDAKVTAFREGLATTGAPFLPQFVSSNQTTVTPGPWVQSTSSQTAGYETAMRSFTQPRENWPDGIVLPSDTMTLGVLAALTELRLEVGDDVKIATQANVGSSLLIGWLDKLVLMQIDPAEIATAMFSCLERLMNGENSVPAIHAIYPEVCAKSLRD